MASVKFEESTRGRSGRIPLSFYAPLMVNDGTPFYKAMPSNGVPKGMGGKDQQVGYWNEQPRWRMRKGVRQNLPSKWHFYYHGTGPHSDKKFREKVPGVFWVAKQGTRVAPTNLGERKRNQPTRDPTFDFDLPSNIEIVNAPSQPNSRASSRSQSRDDGGSKSRSGSKNRIESSGSKTPKKGSNNNSRSNSQERSSSKSKGKGKQDNRDDLVAAVRQALMGLGFQPQGGTGKTSGKNSRSASGKSTPKDTRSKSPARPQNPKSQLNRVEWKRVPNTTETPTACFGPRDVSRNCGTKSVVALGVDAPHFPQIADLIPTPAALFFGSRVEVKEYKDEVEIKYHYKMNVPKEDPNLPYFLQQVDAYLDPQRDETPIPKKQKPKKEVTQQTQSTPTLNPAAPVFTPPVVLPDAVANVELEMVDEVFDADPLGDSTV
uniref:Nucleoprotein n=1 Tax=Miniopterus bat coronavirus/Kenya/KY33/2006 TaxID=983928 RepID=F1DB18_9ALPC|nr:nucleocapsid protein [Miniopterus bat coronavirus/Kenya/KY33/2006]